MHIDFESIEVKDLLIIRTDQPQIARTQWMSAFGEEFKGRFPDTMVIFAPKNFDIEAVRKEEMSTEFLRGLETLG
jgi:hypothetical protein